MFNPGLIGIGSLMRKHPRSIRTKENDLFSQPEEFMGYLNQVILVIKANLSIRKKFITIPYVTLLLRGVMTMH